MYGAELDLCTWLTASAANAQEDHTDDDYSLFLDMVHKMMTYEPAERITPAQALTHPFLQGEPRCPGRHCLPGWRRLMRFIDHARCAERVN